MENVNGVGSSRHQRGGYVAYDDLRQVVRDLLAPLYERLEALRDEVAELKRKPGEDANNRRSDVLVICGIVGAIVAIATCSGGLLNAVVVVALHFMK